MPLSPVVISRYDSTVRHCTHSPLPFLPSPTPLPMGNPLAYKRRPMRRGEGRTPSIRLSTSSSKLTVASCVPEQEPKSTRQAAVGFYASVRPEAGKFFVWWLLPPFCF